MLLQRRKMALGLHRVPQTPCTLSAHGHLPESSSGSAISQTNHWSSLVITLHSWISNHVCERILPQDCWVQCGKMLGSFRMVCLGILAKSNFDFIFFFNNRIILVLFFSLPHLLRAYYYKAVFSEPLETFISAFLLVDSLLSVHSPRYFLNITS